MNKSESIAKLAEALSKAQGAMKNAIKDSNNPYFKSKYADLASVVDSCRHELAANGLAVVQLPTMREGKMVLEYMLMHSSGEWVSNELEMSPVKNDPQGIGSAITYARRYSLASIVGAATEDDDGNAASEPGNNKSAPSNVTRTTSDIPVDKPRIIAAVPPPQPSEVYKEARQNLTAKPAALPEGCVETGQAVNFAMTFKDALPHKLRKHASDIEHAWLKKQGIVDGDGNGTAKAISKESFYDVREAAVEFAAKLEVWP